MFIIDFAQSRVQLETRHISTKKQTRGYPKLQRAANFICHYVILHHCVSLREKKPIIQSGVDTTHKITGILV